MAAAPKPPTPAEAALTDAQNLLQLWLKAKAYLAMAATEDPISRDDEQAFLETKSELSKYQRTMAQKMPPDVGFGADRMQEILRSSISINHLRALPKADKQSLGSNWHYVFIHLSRALGALQFLAEGYVPPPKVAKTGTGIKDMKGAAGAGKDKPKKKGILKKPSTYIALLIIGGIVYYVMNSK